MIYYVNIGSNLGDRGENLSRAVEALAGVGTVLCVSSVVESEPWGFDSSNAFLNVGVAVDSALEPHDALRRLQAIERRLGSAAHRHADGSYADRLVDIDIMAIDDEQGRPLTVRTASLTVPHPHLEHRPFFLAPYRELRAMLSADE